MQDQRPASSQPQHRPGLTQNQLSVQGQPFPGAQYIPPLGLLPFQQQAQLRPQPGQLQGTLPSRPAGGALLPPLNSQWTSTAQMYQALRHQNMASAQGKLPVTNAASAGMASGTRPAGALAKPAEPARKYNKKRKAPEPAAPIVPKAAPLPKERMPRSELLNMLQDQDDKILKAIAQQKSLAHSTLCSGEHVRKKLRIYVQSQQSIQAGPGEPDSWLLSIWGKIIEASDGLPNNSLQPPSNQKHISKQLSYYIKRLVLTVANTNGEPHQEEVIWTKACHKGDAKDRFHFRRQSQEDADAKIQLELDSQPQLYRLEEKLGQFMRCELSTRTAVLQALSTYFKMHSLQDAGEQVRCDAFLQKLFGKDKLRLAELPSLLDSHLRAQDPYTIEYTFRPEGHGRGEIACYDLELYVPVNPNEQHSVAALDKIPPDPTLEHLQLKVNGLVTAANERSRRREMLLGFSNNPSDFINGLLSSQGRDLRAQKPGSIPTAQRRTQLFDGRWLDDAVLRYLHRKLAAGA